MPAVEMRRSTRVFVPKSKDVGHVKVLRSGRRLWGDPSIKTTLKNDVVLFPVIDEDSDYKPSPPRPRPVPRRRQEKLKPKPEPEPEPMDLGEAKKAVETEAKEKELEKVCRSEARVIKNVYSRKRKRNLEVSDSGGGRESRKFGLHFVKRKRNLGVSDSGGGRESSKFGLHFVRRKRRKGVEAQKEDERKVLGDDNCVLSIVFSGFCGGCSVNSRLLVSVLKYLGDWRIGFVQLSGFLVSKPICDVFASVGIRFLLNPRSSMINKGVCRISGARQRVPLFTADFCAIPMCFTGLYFGIFMKSIRVSCSLKLDFHIVQESTCDSELLLCSEDRCDQMSNIPVAPDGDVTGKEIIVAGLEASRVGSRILQFRNAVLTLSPSKRRKRSLRNRRARNPSHFVMQRANGLSVSNNVAFKKNGVQWPMFRGLRRSARKNPACEINESKSGSSSVINEPKSSSGSVDMNVDVDSHQFCSANVLVVETDRCYRIEETEVALDLSTANEWVLAFKKDGVTRYCLKVEKEMRPNSFNRFTHAVIWTAENGLKLEFPDRKDWVVFKELYKLCDDRNLVPSSPAVKNIPVPGVSEVTDFWGSASAFERPESYIRMNSDELSRMLSRRTASYDMDAEDEGWLREFNSGLDEASCLSEDTFELMIDVFEKGSYFGLEDVNDEKTAVSHCAGLASSEIALPVYRYWTKKRKQKGVPLLRVFKLNKPKRGQLMSKPVLRKKRSLKRTPASLSFSRGRGKDSSILQAMAVEHTIIEEQHAVLRAQEARAAFDRFVEVAIQKRQRAQLMMENADLATYRATMALRIADATATRLVEPQQAACHFLDNEDVKGS